MRRFKIPFSAYKSIFIIWIGIVFIFNNAEAQIQRKYNSYTADDGLNQNSIYDIIQDHKGYLWFSTANGISRFDGYEMHNYKFDPKDSTSIYGEFYFTFYVDSKNKLWIGHDKGISYYDRIQNNFVNIYKTNQLNTSNVHNILTEDNDQQLWVLESNKYLYSYDIKQSKVKKKIVISNHHNSQRSTNKKPIFHNEILIFQNFNHEIIYFNTKTYELKTIKVNNHKRTEFERLDHNSYISFSMENSNALIIKFNGKKINQEIIPLNAKGSSSTSNIAYSHGKFYVGTIDGLYIINKNNFKEIEFVKNFGQYAQSKIFMEYIYVDKTENIILGTNGMGIRILSPHLNKFKHIGSNEEMLNMTKSILALEGGKIFVGLHAIGFVIIDSNNTFIQYDFSREKFKDNTNGHVYALTKWSNNEILLTYNNLLLKYDYVQNKIDKNFIKSFNSVITTPVFNTYKNEVYLNINEIRKCSIIKINKDNSITNIFKSDGSHISSHYRYNDTLLIIGRTDGLNLYNTKSKKYIKKIICPYVKSILVTKNKEIYFGTIRGFYKINTRGDILEKYDENSGMANDNIYGMLEDDRGNIWFSHNKGLSIFMPYNKKINNFSMLDGLQSNEFNTGSYHKGADGLIYFGGVNGINIIDPNNIHFNPYPPKISLNAIYLFDEAFVTDTFYNELNVLNLNYTQNTLAFDFSALDFSNPNSNKYKYILEGYDQKYIESGNRHYARYANLPPGYYTLKIFGSNNDGVWSIEPKIIRINIIPPYWQTTWFFITLVFTSILAIIGIVYYFIYRQKIALKRKLELQHQLEIERQRISRDLHDHVGAQLSYLISNLDWLITHPDALEKDEEIKRLSNLSETGRQAILTLRQTIWALNNSELSLEEFFDKYKAFAKKMLEFNPNIQINFKEYLEKNEVLSPGLALNLFRICQEAFANILKHSKATKVDVSIYSNAHTYFRFEIHDNGIGFDLSKIEHMTDHYGISNMKARAEESSAQLEIQSEINKGTRVILNLNVE